MRVHWPLLFHRCGTAEAVETVTYDLSSDGFYCFASTPFVPGECRVCTLTVPTNHPKSGGGVVLVECKVQVMRVQLNDDGRYGIGCRIEDYRFLHPSKAADNGLMGLGTRNTTFADY